MSTKACREANMGITKYYVDVENTGPEWQPILSELKDGDCIALYTSRHTYIQYGEMIPTLQLIREGRLDIREGFVRGRGDSALDYFLMGEVLNEIRRSPDMQAVIISNDRGYDDFIEELTRNGMHARRMRWPMERVKAPREVNQQAKAPATDRKPAPDTADYAASPLIPVRFSTQDNMMRPLGLSLSTKKTGTKNEDALHTDAQQKEKPALPSGIAQEQYSATRQLHGTVEPDSSPVKAQPEIIQETKLQGAELKEYIKKGIENSIRKQQGNRNYLPWFDCGKLADAFIRYDGDFEMVMAYIGDKRRKQILGTLIPRAQRERLRSVL